MNESINDMLSRIHELEDKLSLEIERARAQYGFTIKGKLIEFEKEAIARQTALRKSLTQFFRDSTFLHVLTAPVIYSLIVPFVLMDIWVTIYQHICFRAYGIPRVLRKDYIIIDRHHLKYLNGIEALNCMFCSYCNGIVSYVREVASKTEQYWCPIKHALRVKSPHKRYMKFLDYGDAQGFRAQLEKLREDDRKS